MHEVILEIMVSKGRLKIIIDQRVVHTKKISIVRDGPIDISEGSP